MLLNFSNQKIVDTISTLNAQLPTPSGIPDPEEGNIMIWALTVLSIFAAWAIWYTLKQHSKALSDKDNIIKYEREQKRQAFAELKEINKELNNILKNIDISIE